MWPKWQNLSLSLFLCVFAQAKLFRARHFFFVRSFVVHLNTAMLWHIVVLAAAWCWLRNLILTGHMFSFRLHGATKLCCQWPSITTSRWTQMLHYTGAHCSVDDPIYNNKTVQQMRIVDETLCMCVCAWVDWIWTWLPRKFRMNLPRNAFIMSLELNDWHLPECIRANRMWAMAFLEYVWAIFKLCAWRRCRFFFYFVHHFLYLFLLVALLSFQRNGCIFTFNLSKMLLHMSCCMHFDGWDQRRINRENSFLFYSVFGLTLASDSVRFCKERKMPIALQCSYSTFIGLKLWYEVGPCDVMPCHVIPCHASSQFLTETNQLSKGNWRAPPRQTKKQQQQK